MKAVLLTTAIAAAALAASAPAHASVDPFVGEIMLFSGGFCPDGWYEAHGRFLPIRGNEALFSLLHNSYGGDSATTFALPDLRKAVPAAATDREKLLRYCIAYRGDYPRRP